MIVTVAVRIATVTALLFCPLMTDVAIEVVLILLEVVGGYAAVSVVGCRVDILVQVVCRVEPSDAQQLHLLKVDRDVVVVLAVSAESNGALVGRVPVSKALETVLLEKPEQLGTFALVKSAPARGKMSFRQIFEKHAYKLKAVLGCIFSRKF